MNYLLMLRELADNQQYQALKDSADAAWLELGDAAILPLKALACAQLGGREGAEAALEEMRPFEDQLDLDARVDWAAALIGTGRLEKAKALLNAALLASPEHALAMTRLAYCHLLLGEWTQSKALYQRSLERAPERLPAWLNLVSLQIQTGDTEAAQRALDAARSALAAREPSIPPEAANGFVQQFDLLQLDIWIKQQQLSECDAWLAEQQQAHSQGTRTHEHWVKCVCAYAAKLAANDLHALAELTLRDALQHSPHELALLSQSAELALVQGRTMQAIQMLQRALRWMGKQKDPPHRQIPILNRIADAALRGFATQARTAAEAAVRLASALLPSEDLSEGQIQVLRWQSNVTLAQVECDAQNFDLAESLFGEVMAQQPWFLPALQGLGQLQLQRGKIDEAVELFERVQQVDPVRGLSGLINAHQSPQNVEVLERLEVLAHSAALEGSMRSGLLFQLANAWDKKKDFDRAFKLVREANEASKRHLNYDPKAHRQRCAEIRHAFSKDFFTHRAECGYRGHDESLPVFVVGMPRSGTTLVEQILASHSQIFGAGELGIIPSRVQGLNRWERRVGSGRGYPECVDDLDAKATHGIAQDLIKELKELTAEAKPSAQFVIDKLPHNFENIGLIKFLFPKAKIISVRRDPRDIAISNYFTDYAAKHWGMGFAYDLNWIGQQLADHNLLMHHWHTVFPDEILEIQYEDLVEDTPSIARQMLQYIGVEWEPEVLDFHELDRPVKTASVWQVRQPIYKTSKAKWERYKKHLAPLIAGTNAKIIWDPITRERFPTPAMFTNGVRHFRANRLNDAEYEFKKVQHHFPDHAGASFMLGLIFLRKGHLSEGLALMEKGYQKCPWNKNWRSDIVRACELAGETEKAQTYKAGMSVQPSVETSKAESLDWIFDDATPSDPR